MNKIDLVLNDLKIRIGELNFENAILTVELRESKEKVESLEALLTELKATDK